MKREFSLKDFLVSMLRKWPIILGCAFICALLFGASSYIPTSPEERDIDVENAKEVELEDIKKEIDQLEILKKNYRDANSAGGVLDMNIHEMNFYNLNFMVKGRDDNSDLEEKGTALAYANQIDTGAIYKHLSIEMSEELSKQLPQIIASYAEDGVVFISAYRVENVDVEQIVQDIFRYFEGISDPLTTELLMAEDGTVPRGFYSTFADRQESTFRTLDYYDYSIGQRTQTKEILEAETGVMEEIVRHNPLQRLVVGVAIGIVLGILIGLLMDFFSTTLKDERELEYMGLHNLCSAHIDTSGKKRFFLNRFIDFLAGKVYYYMSEEEQVTYIMAKVSALLVDKKETKDILLTGVAQNEKIRKFYEKLKIKGKKEGYNFILGENANISAETVQSLEKVEHVILVEHLNESKLTEISKICQLVEQQRKEIIGFLVI